MIPDDEVEVPDYDEEVDISNIHKFKAPLYWLSLIHISLFLWIGFFPVYADESMAESIIVQQQVKGCLLYTSRCV